jgi:FtsP/CotA-like multicopper oxidase with cupredoxin domain
MSKEEYSRRQFLGYTGAGLLSTFPRLTFAQQGRVVQAATVDFNPDIEINLTAKSARVPIYLGPETLVWKFHADLVKGPAGTLKEVPNSYLGPVFNFKQGQKIRIHFSNQIPQRCIVHWHGLHVPQVMDGHPMYAIDSGNSYVYEFTVVNRAGMYWYHSHTHELTAKQVYSGLAGLIIVSDDNEVKLALPNGAKDLPIVIQDRSFTEENKLRYTSHMREHMMGFLGEEILVNGHPDFQLSVSQGVYRLRLINGSNSRIYKLAWSDQSSFTVIGTDGGLLEKPVRRNYITLAPAERVEIWVDFREKELGSIQTLISLPFESMRRHMGSSLSEGSEFSIMKVKVTEAEKVADSRELPDTLSTINSLGLADVINPELPMTIALRMRRMNWWLNGEDFEMMEATPSEHVQLNSHHLIQFDNGYQTRGGMRLPHPMHLHGQQFQIIKREINPNFQNAYDTLSKGFVDNGWKDTVLVMPGERVTIVKPFEDFKGLFLYHCHNLEHEDMGMMRNFDVV